MTRTVLVTGATGFVGRHLTKRLRQSGDHVVGLARSGGDVSVDLCDVAALRQAIESVQPDVVIHLAATVTGARHEDLYRAMYRCHVLGTRSLVLALAGSKTRIVAAGSYAELGDAPAPFTAQTLPLPASPYGLTKLLATEVLRMRALEEQSSTVVLRAANLYGPGQRSSYFIPSLLRTLHQGERFSMSPGEQKREFLYVDDFVDALILASDVPLSWEQDDDGAPFCMLYVGDGTPLPLKDVAQLAQRAMQVDGLLGIGERPYRRREQMAMFADLSLTYRLLGWKPKTEWEHGLRQCVAEIVK